MTEETKEEKCEECEDFATLPVLFKLMIERAKTTRDKLIQKYHENEHQLFGKRT